jgi:REP element-mobilizing transposase RayT
MLAGKQMEFALPERRSWGGKRKGAGRPARRSGVEHGRRELHEARHPVHCTLRVVREVGYLRAKQTFGVIKEAIRLASSKEAFRIVCFSVQHNHLHLIVEAEDERALGRGMQGLAIRVARGINRLLHRGGPVFTDRYHRHDLASPQETRACIAYVLQNFRKHARERGQRCNRGWTDPCSSAPWFEGWSRRIATSSEPPPVARAKTWLLSKGWQIHGLISPDETPGARR